MMEMIAAARKRGRSRSDSNTRPGSKKMPVKVCPVVVAAASLVSETGTGGAGGGTKSLLLGSLICLSSVVVRGRGESIRPIPRNIARYVDDTQSSFARFQVQNSATAQPSYFAAAWPEVQITSFSLLPNHF